MAIINHLDKTIQHSLNSFLAKIEDIFESDVVTYYGGIEDGYVRFFLEVMEDLAKETTKERLCIILTTPGGSINAVESMVRIMRHHYSEVHFIVPEIAMSAGTVWCMSGDEIHMDYSSSLGPIDPQVYNGKRWVPALGYLSKLAEISAKDVLTRADYALLDKFDLAEIKNYEEIRNLTITLLKQWLVSYKFKNWDTHSTTNPGTSVTSEEKEERAAEIAKKLCDHERWHSHSRKIGLQELRDSVRLRVQDFTELTDKRNAIRTYHSLLTDYFNGKSSPLYIHSRLQFF